MDMKAVFDERRSVNYFDKSRSIPDDVLRSIFELASLAPSAFNLQPWKVALVKTAEAKDKLCALSNNQPKIVEASAVAIIAGDKNGFDISNPAWKNLERIMGGNSEAFDGAVKAAAFLYGSSEERRIKFAESNAALFAMSLMYSAKYYGVDSHPMSGIDFDGVRKEFGFPDNMNVVMLIALGYFDGTKELYPRMSRFGYGEIVREF